MNRTPDGLKVKTHYEILDGLRGVAALVVVIFHTCEVYSGGDRFKQVINHGYLAVDFFFLLSGFVIAYAYDDRWTRMTSWDFYRRRLIRLQPMVLMGNLIGAALFYLQRSPTYPLIASTPVWKLTLVLLAGCIMMPLLPVMDIRGGREMYPLNGPAWSLFFEYVANVLYAAGLRKLSNRALGVLVLLSAALLAHLAIAGGRGDVIGGWSIGRIQWHVGFARLLYPFLAGILLMRLGTRIHVRNAFPLCSCLLVIAFTLPRFGGAHVWVNGLYESACILVLFPLIVAMGAGASITGATHRRICRFLGDLSYPLYITHYPLVYLYTPWVLRNHVPAAYGAMVGALLFLASIAIAYACLKLYDEPVRAWLAQHLARRSVSSSSVRSGAGQQAGARQAKVRTQAQRRVPLQ